MMAIVPNRRSVWDSLRRNAIRPRPSVFAQADHGIAAADQVHADRLGEALFMPPVNRGWFLRSALAWERIGEALPIRSPHPYRRGDQAGLSRDSGAREHTRLIPSLGPVLVPSSSSMQR